MSIKSLITVGYEIPGYSNDYVDFWSSKSLMDADIVLFVPRSPKGDYQFFRGKRSYGDHASFTYKYSINHWKKELSQFLDLGKTVIILLAEKEDFFLHTGEKKHSGTGKNQKTTNIVAQHTNYEFLPITIGNIFAVKGTHIEFKADNIFSDFYRCFKHQLEYQGYIENSTGSPIFTGKDQSKTLGALHKSKTGHLIVLPYLPYDIKKFTEQENNAKIWTKEGLKFGQTLISCILSIDKSLTDSSFKTATPSWALSEKYQSLKEKSIYSSLKKNRRKIEQLNIAGEKLQQKLQIEEQLKDLLFENGTALEDAVTYALKLLGYQAENYDDGTLELDQVILSPEGHRYVGECEGKDNKAISIDKYRQLAESLNADFAREGVTEKAFGILFGNAERLVTPENRTSDFTDKCKTGAARDKIALIRTIDLFKVAQYLRENMDTEFQLACRNAIHNNLGKIVEFPPVPIVEKQTVYLENS